MKGGISEGMSMKQFTPCYLPALGWTIESLLLVPSIKEFIMGHRLACRVSNQSLIDPKV